MSYGPAFEALWAQIEARLKRFEKEARVNLGTQAYGSLPPRNLPPAGGGGGSPGAVTLSDDDPEDVTTGAADPGDNDDVSRSNHVHHYDGNALLLQGRALAATAPSSGDVITWDASGGGTWKPSAAGSFTSPLTTRGDILTRDASTHVRLAIGASGRYLRSDGTDPSWSPLLASDLTYSGLTTGQVLRATGASAAAFGAVDLANANAITGALPIANGGTGQTAANAAYAALAPLTTRGDLVYRNATVPARLAVGTANQVLITDGTDPLWGAVNLSAAAAVTGILTLARGGLNASLAATGPGVLRQATTGAAITVSALNAATASDVDFQFITGSSNTGATLQFNNGTGLPEFNPVNLAASTAVTGILALVNGGTGANLSATGGTNQMVRQDSAGGVFTVSVLAANDIPALLNPFGIRAALGSVANGLYVPWLAGDALITSYFGSAASGMNHTAILAESNSATALSATSVTGTPIISSVNDTGTTNQAIAMSLRHGTSGATAASFGATLIFEMHDDGHTYRRGGSIRALWTVATAAGFSSALTFATTNATVAAEKMRLNPGGALWVGLTASGLTGAGDLEIAGNFKAAGATPVFGGFTLTVPATGTVALLGTAQTYTANRTITATLDAKQLTRIFNTSGSTGYGLRFGDGTTDVGSFQSLDTGAATSFFFSANRQFDGTAWQQLNARVGSTLLMTATGLGFHSFPAASSTPTLRFFMSVDGWVKISEITAPTAPAANDVIIYAVDNGAGKTQLMALFSSGAAQQLAIQP